MCAPVMYNVVQLQTSQVLSAHLVRWAIKYSRSHYGTAQRKLDTCMRSVDSVPEGYISTTRYGHVGAHWDFSCVKQSLPVTSVDVLKRLHMLYAIKHTHKEIQGRCHLVVTRLLPPCYYLVATLFQQACNNFVIETVTTLYPICMNITTLLQGNAVFNKSVMLNFLYGMPVLG